MLTEEERKERRLEYYKRYYAANKEKVKDSNRKYKAANKEKAKEIGRKYLTTVVGEQYFKEKDWRRRGITGMTMERYNAMCDECGHVCEMCREGNTRAGKPISLDVDHDHKTGEVRGLLCNHCNQKLGKIEEHSVIGPHKCGVKVTEQAIAYMLTATLRKLQQPPTSV